MKAKLLIWFMSTRFYRFLLKYVIPEITIFHGPGPGYAVKENLRREMRAGDVLVSKSKFLLTNLLIGGDYSHAAIVISKNLIAEMSSNGFDLRTVNDFCKKTTRISMLRFKDGSQDYGLKVAEKALSFSNSTYDFSFDLANDLFYCSELVYASDFEHRGGFDLTDLVGLGKPYLSPVGVYEGKGLNVIFEWEDRY